MICFSRSSFHSRIYCVQQNSLQLLFNFSWYLISITKLELHRVRDYILFLYYITSRTQYYEQTRATGCRAGIHGDRTQEFRVWASVLVTARGQNRTLKEARGTGPALPAGRDRVQWARSQEAGAFRS